MLKLLLCLLILLGGTGAGWCLAQPLKERKQQLTELIALLEGLQEELLYTRAPLAELLQRAGSSGVTTDIGTDSSVHLDIMKPSAAGRLLQSVGQKLERDSLQTPASALRESLQEPLGLSLQKEDRRILQDLAAELGKTAAEGQKGLFHRTLAALRKQEQDAAQVYEKKGRMYRGMGTAGAVLLVVLLI